MDTLRPAVSLWNLSGLMDRHGISMPKLTQFVTREILDRSVDRTYLGDLASHEMRRVREPWLHEAAVIAKAFSLNTIHPLVSSDPIVEFDPGPEDVRGDLAIWRTGCPLPLSHAYRLARRFGLADPMDLHNIIQLRRLNPGLVEMWATILSGERTGALVCPWCLAPHGTDHLDTCVPGLLHGARDKDVETTIGQLPRPRKAGVRQFGSELAFGLKAVRERLCRTQTQMAEVLGCSAAHYSRLEGCKAPITHEMVNVLRAKFGVDPKEIHHAPDGALPSPNRRGKRNYALDMTDEEWEAHTRASGSLPPPIVEVEQPSMSDHPTAGGGAGA